MIHELLAFVMPRFFVPNEPHQVRVLKFSDAILRGCKGTVADGHQYLSYEHACVLGAAIKGAGWTAPNWHPAIGSHMAFYQRHFGYYGDMHRAYLGRFGTNFERDLYTGTLSREEIARRFRVIGE
jgi:hypothetical protein